MFKVSASHNELANAVRFLSIDAVQAANSGHPGMPLGMADVATVLYTKFLKFDPNYPEWPNRDRFILSAGHGSMLAYSLMYLCGYKDIDLEQIKNFRQLGYRTAGHPEYGHARGIETTTGPLGQGLAMASGFALGERITAAKFGSDLIDHFTYVIVGDGCLMEGVSQEAISFIGHKKLNKLIVFWDNNSITIDGSTDISTLDDQKKRFESSGWDVQEINGHNQEEITAAITRAQSTLTPSLIACETVIGFGSPNKQGTSATHGAPLGEEEVAATRKALNWPYAPFEVPQKVLESWHTAAHRNSAKEWYAAAQSSENGKKLFTALEGHVPQELNDKFQEIKTQFIEENYGKATRQSLQAVLKQTLPLWNNIIGGSADLTGSNGTFVKNTPIIDAPNYHGNYINYGVREFGMGATMNGLILYGGIRPYGGTFLVFSDYVRPAIRLSALMQQPVIYVMTHDSIGLGEDGPTHQPIEHIASLRAMPNLNVFRPADAVEVAECWEIALNAKETPSILALTRQGVPLLRKHHTPENKSAYGAYEIFTPHNETADATIFSTGSEVAIAIDAAEQLSAQGIPTRVVSVPCWELFEGQSQAYKEAIIAPETHRVAIEAASSFGWEKFVGNGAVISIDNFGASGQGKDLYAHFNLTVTAVVARLKEQIAAHKE